VEPVVEPEVEAPQSPKPKPEPQPIAEAASPEPLWLPETPWLDSPLEALGTEKPVAE